MCSDDVDNVNDEADAAREAREVLKTDDLPTATLVAEHLAAEHRLLALGRRGTLGRHPASSTCSVVHVPCYAGWQLAITFGSTLRRRSGLLLPWTP